jgi:rod shape determining protein RodA
VLNSYTSSKTQSFYVRNVFRFLSGIDWWLVLACAFLIAVSLTTLKHSGQAAIFYEKQINFIIGGVVAGIIVWRIPYFFWVHKPVVIGLYILNIILLVAVMKFGHAALGAQRWLTIGPITLQPSEIAKPIIIFTLAAWLKKNPIRSFFDTFKVTAIIAPPALLVFKQPDLGTSLTFACVFLGMSFWAGATLSDVLVLTSPALSLVLNAVDLSWWYIYLAILCAWLLLKWRNKTWPIFLRLAMIVIVVSANYGFGVVRPHMWGMLKEYQQKRLTSFVNPYADPQGSGYHILQSLIAIGSGGVTGTGLGKGNQSQGSFIPERHTDFIFAVVGEELGFKITALVIIAYAIICLRCLVIAYQAREEQTGSLICIGIMAMFLFHVFLNIGMTMGIMPVAGVPLPFLSYGGTALVVDLMAIGLLQSIALLNPPPRTDIWR